MNLNELTQAKYQKTAGDCTDAELYLVLLEETQRLAAARKPAAKTKKKLYYVSAEFLVGKLLSNNLINLGVYEEVKQQLSACGKSLSAIEEVEPEPSLGNGGLGRLAACFLDSIAALGLNGDGIGLNYHFGLFHQVLQKNVQTAQPDPWITDQSWLKKTDTVYTVSFGTCSVQARMYDILVPGYENDTTNTLHLFDIETVDETLVKDGIDFDKTAVEKNLTLFLYPDDSDENGRLLRVYQEYLMVSAGAQLILDECTAKGCQLTDLADYAAIQINDTHPTMIIPELIRLMTARGVALDDAIAAVSKTCAYTNHTILAEALEKWPISYLQKAVPQLIPILEILDDKVRRKYENPKTVIIDHNDTVHMAHLDIHYSHSVNGVASLHTEILKEVELHHFYEIYPEKFNNKTNGITFRRWLLHCNPRLTDLIASRIGNGFRKDPMELEKLLDYQKDPAFLKELLAVKHACKQDLADYLQETQQITLNPDAIFDIQIKRLHEYKRQQL
ncbi:glycogen/starch/alpha-glucan family phosphorylase, partial [uncultured Ruminococcus sp.]